MQITNIFSRQFFFLNHSKILVILSGIIGVVGAFNKRWVCDDAFISFRYARNAARGLGLVYNEGERVEGFTNFLWTVLFVPVHYFSFDPIFVSWVLGLLIFILSLYLIFEIEGNIILQLRGLKSTNKSIQLFIPIASMAWALNELVQIFSTSGLETALYTCLILAGILTLLQNSNTTFKASLGFLFLVLATMTRPDGILVYGLCVLMVGLIETNYLSKFSFTIFRKSLITQWPFLIIYIPYHYVKYDYYGWFWPNTYYAKSGNSVHYEQGIRYLLLFLNSYYVFYLLPAILVYFVFRFFNKKFKYYDLQKLSLKKFLDILGNCKKFLLDQLNFKVIWLLIFPAIFSILYYTRMGGGFMFGRFFVPSLPALYLLLSYGIYKIAQNYMYHTKMILMFTIIILLSTIFKYDPYKHQTLPIIDGIVLEHKIYTRSNIQNIRTLGTSWNKIFRKKNIRIAIGGSEAAFAYYLDPHFVLEAATGLTDEYLAHRVISKRGQVGHEKFAGMNYLRKKSIHLHFHGAHLTSLPRYQYLKVRGMPPGQRIITWNSDIMKSLSAYPDFKFEKFPNYLDQYIKRMPLLPKISIRRDLNKFVDYYFKYNKDPRRYSIIKNQLAKYQ